MVKMTKRTATKQCIKLMEKYNVNNWHLCYTEERGYFPSFAENISKNKNKICVVRRDGSLGFFTKKNAIKHHLNYSKPKQK